MKYIKNRFELVLITIIKLIDSGLQVLNALLTALVVNALTDLNKDLFIRYIIYTMICLFLQNAVYLLTVYLDKRFIRVNMVYVKQQMYNSIFKYNMDKFSKNPLKYYNSFFINDLGMLENKYYRSILSIISNTSMLLCSCLGILYISPWFVVCLPLTFLACVYFPKIFNKKCWNRIRV